MLGGVERKTSPVSNQLFFVRFVKSIFMWIDSAAS